MELGRGGETSEGQATLAFTGNNLMCGHARRGSSKRIQFKLMRWQQHFKIYEFYALNDFIPSNSARTHSPHILVIAVNANPVTLKPPSDLKLLLPLTCYKLRSLTTNLYARL